MTHQPGVYVPLRALFLVSYAWFEYMCMTFMFVESLLSKTS